LFAVRLSVIPVIGLFSETRAWRIRNSVSEIAGVPYYSEGTVTET